MTWFEEAFGVREDKGYPRIQKLFRVEADADGDIPGAQRLIAPNDQVFPIGVFEVASLKEIRDQVALAMENSKQPAGGIPYTC